MRRILKALTAIIAVAALPLVAVAPASAAAANPYDIYFEFDCNEHYWDYDVPLYGDTATIHFVNCAVGNYLQDADDTGFASTTSVVIDDVTENAIGTVTATGPVEIKVIAGPNQPGLVDDEHFANIIILTPRYRKSRTPRVRSSLTSQQRSLLRRICLPLKTPMLTTKSCLAETTSASSMKASTFIRLSNSR